MFFCWGCHWWICVGGRRCGLTWGHLVWQTMSGLHPPCELQQMDLELEDLIRASIAPVGEGGDGAGRRSQQVMALGGLRTAAEVARGIACGPILRVRGERG